ncbi:GPW/gp25 family protein [Bradyrhizobium sp. SZCCHNS3051]|uniref:GPW/gp25 family protein n=1 Tax=Bradyrhizobium sp. SZCCHNS3051 TaxID=3057320 RepID=UPI002916F9E9|nr:GPW/gp25 family protein [Bradyrhizobium sp. SZCCHNS3051]
MTRIAGWHFGGLLGNDMDLGPHPSLTGSIALVQDDACVRQSIMMLISTIPGERVMRPDYGCPLHRIVFSPNDDTTAGLAIHYVQQALMRFEPRIEILRVDADRFAAASPDAGDGTTLVVRLEYRVRATQRSDTLAISVNLAGNHV